MPFIGRELVMGKTSDRKLAAAVRLLRKSIADRERAAAAVAAKPPHPVLGKVVSIRCLSEHRRDQDQLRWLDGQVLEAHRRVELLALLAPVS